MRKLNVTDGQTDRRTDGGALQYLPSRAFGAAGDKNMLAEIGHGIEVLDLSILNNVLREINISELGGAPLECHFLGKRLPLDLYDLYIWISHTFVL